MIQSWTIQSRLLITRSFSSATRKVHPPVHSGVIEPLHIKPLMKKPEKAADRLLSAIRRGNGPAAWKAYMNLKNAGHISQLPELYHSMTVQTFQLKDNGTYSPNYLKFYRKCVSDILETAIANGYILNSRDYNLLLKLYGRSRDWKAVTDCWNEIPATAATEETFNIYMRAAIQCRKPEEVFNIYSKMMKVDVKPDVNTYGLLIEANGRMGNINEADKVFLDHFVPKRTDTNKMSFISRLLVKEPKNQFHTASAAPLLLHTIPPRSVLTPTVNTFEALMDAHGRNNNIPGLHHIYKTMMPQYHIQPNLKIYDTLIKWYCRHGDTDAAQNVFIDMEQRGIKPTVTLFNHLFRYEALKKNRPKVAEALIDYMKTKYGIKPMPSMYTTLIKIHNKHNRENEASRLHEIYKQLKSNREQ